MSGGEGGVCGVVAGCLAFLASACGSGHVTTRASGSTSTPPSAHATTSLGSATLPPGTFCWTTQNADGTGQAVCADAAEPTCTTVPQLPAAANDPLRVQLPFDPTEVDVSVDAGTASAIAPARNLTIALRGAGGLVQLTAWRGSDDVVYGVCIVRD